MTIELELQRLGLTLPSPPPPAGSYVPAVQSGNLAFLSGVVARDGKGAIIAGKLGRDLTVEQGQEAARQCTLSLLANLKALIGDLDRVTRIVRVTGMVNASADFTQHPQVVNGASDLLQTIFGERGLHTRAAVGMNSLPLNTAVELDMVVEVA